MKEKNKTLHIVIMIICIIAYIATFMYMGPLKPKDGSLDSYMGAMTQVEIILCTVLITTNRARGFISACILSALSFFSALMGFLRGNTNALNGILISVISIATMSIIFIYLNINESQKKELSEQYDKTMDANRIMQEQNEALKTLTYTDRLTSIPNRQYFVEQMEEAIRLGMPFSVIYADADNFKYINDTLGPKTGDAALIAYAERFSGYCGRKYKFARVAGDEFAILLTGEQTEADVLNIIEQLRRMCSEPVNALGTSVGVTMSYGIVAHPRDGRDAEILLDNAVMATYNAKANGKDRPCFFSPSN